MAESGVKIEYSDSPTRPGTSQSLERPLWRPSAANQPEVPPDVKVGKFWLQRLASINPASAQGARATEGTSLDPSSRATRAYITDDTATVSCLFWILNTTYSQGPNANSRVSEVTQTGAKPLSEPIQTSDRRPSVTKPRVHCQHDL